MEKIAKVTWLLWRKYYNICYLRNRAKSFYNSHNMTKGGFKMKNTAAFCTMLFDFSSFVSFFR